MPGGVSYSSVSTLASLLLGVPSAPLRQCCFCQQNLKLLSVQLERNRWQILTAVYSGACGGTFVSSVPFQVADRRSCNGWHGRAASQSRFRIPGTECLANTSLKLCREAGSTICSANCTILGGTHPLRWRTSLGGHILSSGDHIPSSRGHISSCGGHIPPVEVTSPPLEVTSPSV